MVPLIKSFFKKNSSGNAIIEFSLILPILFFIIAGLVETSRIVIIKGKLESLSYSSGQVFVALDSSTVYSADSIINGQIIPFVFKDVSTSGLKGKIAMVRRVGTNYVPQWEVNPSGGATTLTYDHSLFVSLENGKSAVVADYLYEYQPLMFSSIFGTINLSARLIHFNPRV
jgi:hypothetical protein